MYWLYAYLIGAGVGLVSIPSFYAHWKVLNPNKGWYDWTQGESDPLHEGSLLFACSILWPVWIVLCLGCFVYDHTGIRNLPGMLWSALGFPGRLIAKRSLAKIDTKDKYLTASHDIETLIEKYGTALDSLKPKDPFIEAGEKEVEALLSNLGTD